jgi:multidrug efflux system membrane fusion protein
MRKIYLAAFLLPGVGLAGLWMAGRSSPVVGLSGVAPTPVPVGVSPAARSDVPIYLNGLGNVQAFNSVAVRAQVDGQIVEVAVREGQEVKAGEVLVRIDPRSYQAALDQALAKKAQDQAQLANARRDLQRYTLLLQQNSIARQQVDTTQAQVAQLEAIVKGDAAAIDLANVNLGYATIKSPLDGRAGIRRVDVGNVVHASEATGIITITQTRPISILFTLPEETLQDIVKAMAAGPLPVAALSRDGERQFDLGALALIDNAIDQTTGTIRLKATLPNKAGLLWPGQFVTARLHVKTLHGALTIPSAAIQNGPEGSFAYRVKSDGAVDVRKLRLGPATADIAVVEAGLDEGDLVVTSGQYRLQSGAKVAIAARASAPPVVASEKN